MDWLSVSCYSILFCILLHLDLILSREIKTFCEWNGCLTEFVSEWSDRGSDVQLYWYLVPGGSETSSTGTHRQWKLFRKCVETQQIFYMDVLTPFFFPYLLTNQVAAWKNNPDGEIWRDLGHVIRQNISLLILWCCNVTAHNSIRTLD